MENPLEPSLERKAAVTLYNHVWTLLGKPDRTEAEDDEMERASFASLYHWSNIGNAGNLAIGEWQVAHVYLVLGRLAEAERFAKRVVSLCEANELGDFRLAYGYLELARICRAAGRHDEAAKWLETAKAVEIADEHDREHFEEDLVADGW